MDRKLFLNLCQKYAVLCPHINHDKDLDIPDDMLVNYEGIIYYPVAYKLTFDEKGNAVHIAVLKERYVNCIREIELGKVNENVY